MAKKKPKPDDELEKLPLNEKQKQFCREYIYDWNATRSYKAVYPDITNDESAKACASRLLTNVNIKNYIKDIQLNLEELAGISRLKVIQEHMKMAFSSIAQLHNTWIELKEFEALTDEQKQCIEEISTKKQHKTEWEYSEDEGKKIPIDYTVEYVKIKLYDKQKSLDAINRMLGYDAPIKTIMDLNIPNLPKVIIE